MVQQKQKEDSLHIFLVNPSKNFPDNHGIMNLSEDSFLGNIKSTLVGKDKFDNHQNMANSLNQLNGNLVHKQYTL